MAAIGSGYQVAGLNWYLNGATVTRPTGWAVNLSQGIPNATSASEWATGSGITRQTCSFQNPAVFNAGSATASNSSAMTWGPISAAGTASGVNVWDNTSSGVGTLMWYGTLATAVTLASGSSLVIPAGSLTISLQ